MGKRGRKRRKQRQAQAQQPNKKQAREAVARRARRVRVVLFAITLLGILGAVAWTATSHLRQRASVAASVPPMQDAVTDTAGRLTPADDRALEERITAYRQKTGNEIAVFVTGSLGGQSIEDVAYATFNAWGIGQKGKDNGVLLVIAPNERKTRIETGKGIGHLLTDLDCAHILRDRVGPLLRQDRFKDAIVAALDAIEAALEGRPPPGAPTEVWAAAAVRGMYVVDVTRTVDDAIVAQLEEEAAKQGVLFSNIAVFIMSNPPPRNSSYDATAAWHAPHEALRAKRLNARLDADPMIVFIDPETLAVVTQPITVIQGERVKSLGPRFEAAGKRAKTLEEAIRAITKEQIAFARAEAEVRKRSADTAEAAKKSSDAAETKVLLGVAAFASLFIAFCVWLGLRGAKSGGGGWSSGGSSSSYDSSSYGGSSSYDAGSSIDTSYSGGGGSSGGGGASDSY